MATGPACWGDDVKYAGTILKKESDVNGVFVVHDLSKSV